MTRDNPWIFTTDSADYLALFYMNAEHSDELTPLQSCDEEHDFVFVVVCWRLVTRSGERNRWDAELGFEKLLRAYEC